MLPRPDYRPELCFYLCASIVACRALREKTFSAVLPFLLPLVYGFLSDFLIFCNRFVTHWANPHGILSLQVKQVVMDDPFQTVTDDNDPANAGSFFYSKPDFVSFFCRSFFPAFYGSLFCVMIFSMNEATIKKITAGVLAHVDAGKTTLCESLLYLTGRIRSCGRVDQGNSHLDTHTLEKQRGITIFSSQATLEYGGMQITLLDTPGHIDFAAEMERTLSVLDYAILVVSGNEGVQAHTETLWRLLERYAIPVFLFITKMDMPNADPARVIKSIHARLSTACVDFRKRARAAEDAAALDEVMLEKYLTQGDLSDNELGSMIRARKLFPCFFGSGLKMTGIEAFLQGFCSYTQEPPYFPDFAAQVFKISRDAQNNRSTWLKLAGGVLNVRTELHYRGKDGEARSEKVTQIRVYAGERFESVESVSQGDLCAVLGLSETQPGTWLGLEGKTREPLLQSVLTYRVLPPEDCDARVLLQKLKLIEDEEPQLHILWNEAAREIHAQLMGEVQLEILQSVILSRFNLAVKFTDGRILYRETIDKAVEGIAHFEPLRHYAELRLLLEPLPRGSGLVFASCCPIDQLASNLQRLVLTHLAEKQHLGVLIGAPITDMRITLLTGRAHSKHTEGGDFRQATYRAVRQGLMRAKSVLLEPYYAFSLELPTEFVGRALNDLERMSASVKAPETNGEESLLSGRAPVSAMRSYAKELAAYTRGRGRLSFRFDGYAPCANAEAIIAQSGYFPQADIENTADSVFCSHGAGVIVKWDDVEARMHTNSPLQSKQACIQRPKPVSDQELEAILLKTVGPIKRPLYTRATQAAVLPEQNLAEISCKHLLIDGYNVLFAWDALKALSEEDLDAARSAFMDILCNYCGVTGENITLVFDAYKTDTIPQERFDYKNIQVVFTAKDESADVYIAQRLCEMGEKYSARVVTSDHLIRLSAWGSSALMTGAREFIAEVEHATTHVREIIESTRQKSGSTIGEHLKQK